jgi:hypothetical protein
VAVLVRDKLRIYKSDGFTSNSFSIAATPEAFCILSDRLYSHKIRAVIRELSTNAVDSHIAADNFDTQYDVHLPSISEPWFDIRDYGVGLAVKVYLGKPDLEDEVNLLFSGSYAEIEEYVEQSEYDVAQDADNIQPNELAIVDDAREMYTTYFHSTRVKSNDYTGQLGLGSKSPFAYTDSFQVTVYYHNEKREYICSLNDNRIPEINLINESVQSTDEHDGLEVKLAVKNGDFFTFNREARRVYRYFNLQPNITTHDYYECEPPTYLVEAEGWQLCADTEGAQAIMGNIAYPINPTAKGLSDQYTKLLQLKLDIHFDIGEVDITPSREALSYNLRTVNNIKKRLDIIIDEISDQVSEKFEKADTLWEARCLAHAAFYEHGSELGVLTSLAEIRKLTWQGIELGDLQIKTGHIKGLTVVRFYPEDRYQGRWYHRDKVGVTAKKSEITRLTPKSETRLYESDIPRGAKTRVMDKVRQDEKDVYLFTFDSKQARDELIECIGITEDMLIPASKLPKPSYTRGVHHKSTEQVFEHRGSMHHQRFYEYWKQIDVKVDDGGIYVELCRYQAKNGGHNVVHPQQICEIINVLKRLGNDIRVVGVRPQVAKQFRKSDDWVDLWDYTRHFIKQHFIQNDTARHIANIRSIFATKHAEDWLKLARHIVIHNKASAASKFFDAIRELQGSIDHRTITDDIKRLCNAANITTEKVEPKYDLVTLEKEVLRSYPMAALLIQQSYNLDDTMVREISSYINLQNTQQIQTVEISALSNEDEDDQLPF